MLIWCLDMGEGETARDLGRREKRTRTRDEGSTVRFEGFAQFVGGVRVDGRAIDEQLALNVALDEFVDEAGDVLVCGDTGENYVCFGGGFLGAGCHGAAAELLG